MDMPKNLLKQKLQQDQLQLGLFMGLGSSVSTEILSTTGFDFLLVDAEHSYNSPQVILQQLQAMAPYATQPAVRTVNHDPAMIKQLLGVGVQTFVFPMVDSAEQAQALVQSVHYPPMGIRGVGTVFERGARWNAIQGYFEKAGQEMCVIVQVESREGLDNLDAIASVEGVDGVFVGPSDLAASLGHLGKPAHPEVRAAVMDAISRIRSHGKIAGVFAADPSVTGSYIDQGVRMLAVGADTGLLRSAAVNLLSQLRPASGTAGAAY